MDDFMAAALRPREIDYSLDNPPAGQYRTRYWTGATLVNDWLYIDGGDVCSTEIDSEPCVLYSTVRRMNSTLAMPMDKSWSNTNITWTATPHPEQVPNMLASRLQSTGDGKGFYTIGGWQSGVTTSDVPSNDQMWKFVIDSSNPSTGKWEVEDLASDTAANLRRTNENAIARSSTKIFDLGGSFGGLSDSHGLNLWQPNPYIRIFDLDAKKWSKEPTPWGTSALTGATSVYAEQYGDEGVLVVFGGQFVSRPYLGRVGRTEVDAGYDQVRIYDTAQNKWFTQTATGSVPSRRQGACVGSQYSKDDGTLEIFMYGGLLQKSNNEDTDFTSDLYVLTIPGFHWTLVADNTTIPAKARGMHACVVAGQRNMVSIGGLEMLFDNFGVDAIPNGVDVLDLTTLKWTGEYVADADAYRSADIVKGWYSDGNLGNVEWSSSGLRAIMLHENTTTSSPPTTEPKNDPDAQSPPSTTTPSNNNRTLTTGAIVGIGIGAAIFVILFLCGIIWCYRRRSRLPRLPKISIPVLPVVFGSRTSHYEVDGASRSPDLPGMWAPTPKDFGKQRGLFIGNNNQWGHLQSVRPMSPAELMTPDHQSPLNRAASYHGHNIAPRYLYHIRNYTNPHQSHNTNSHQISNTSPHRIQSTHSHQISNNTPRLPPMAHIASAMKHRDGKTQSISAAAVQKESTPYTAPRITALNTTTPHRSVLDLYSPESAVQGSFLRGSNVPIRQVAEPDKKNNPGGLEKKGEGHSDKKDRDSDKDSRRETAFAPRPVSSWERGAVTSFTAGPVSPWDRSSAFQRFM